MANRDGAASDLRRGLYWKVGWRLIPLLMLCYVSSYVDRSNIGIAKLQFSKFVGLTEAAYGAGGGLFYLGYCLFEVPSNLVLSRVGARLTIVRIMLLWSLCSAAFALLSRPWHFFALRFLLGVAEAGFFPGVLLYLSQWAPVAQRARFTALFMSAMALSGVITGPLSGAILAHGEGLGGLHAWQWLFLLEGLPGIGLALVVYFFLPDSPAAAPWLSPEERRIIAADMMGELSTIGGARQQTWTAALKDRRVYILAAMSVALIGGIGGISLWVPTLIKQSGMKSLFAIGLLSSVPYIIAVAAQQLIARRSDRLGERKWHAVVPAAVAAAGWLIMPLVRHSTPLSVVVLCFVAAGSFGATGPFWTMPAVLLSRAAAAGGIAVITTFGGVGGFLSPIIVGWLADRTGNLSAGLYYYGALMGLGALALVCFGSSEAVQRGTSTKRR